MADNNCTTVSWSCNGRATVVRVLHDSQAIVQRSYDRCTTSKRSCNSRASVARPPSDRTIAFEIVRPVVQRAYDHTAIKIDRKRSQLFFEHVQNSKSIADDRSRSHAPCDRSYDRLRSRSQAVRNWSQRNCERGFN